MNHLNDQELREQCRKEAEAKYPAEGMPHFDGEVSYGPSWRQAYAEALFTERKSNRELVQRMVNTLNTLPLTKEVEEALALAASKGITPTT